MEENKKTEGSGSVFKDIAKQATDDILIPKAKEVTNSFFTECVYMFCDWVVGMITKRIYGKDAPVKTSRSSSRGIDYNKISSKPNLNTALRQSDELIEIPISTQSEAENIRLQMLERIEKYDKVSVGFYYTKAGKSSIVTATDYKFGWTNPNDIQWEAKRVDGRDLYFMDLPKPQPIA